MSYFRNQQVYDAQQAVSARVTSHRDLSTVKQVRLLGTNFNGNTLDTNVWTSSVSGTGAVAIYDNTAGSGTLIGSIDMAKSSSITTLLYQCDFSNGLTYVTSSGVGDITFIWD